MLGAGELVVVGVRRPHPERAGGEGKLVGGVGEREVERLRPGPGAERAQARSHRPHLAGAPGAAVGRPDDVVADRGRVEQLERLGEVARGDPDLVPAFLEQPDQRPEERHVRRVRHVDPDLHAPTVSCPGTGGRAYLIERRS